jgi:hypothetical protein
MLVKQTPMLHLGYTYIVGYQEMIEQQQNFVMLAGSDDVARAKDHAVYWARAKNGTEIQVYHKDELEKLWGVPTCVFAITAQSNKGIPLPRPWNAPQMTATEVLKRERERLDSYIHGEDV